MKNLKKINKGLVLTIIIVAILCVYLLIVENKRNESKPEIEKTVQEYVELVNKYAVIPSDMQKIYDSETNEEEKVYQEMDEKLSEYLNQYEAELKTKMIDNQTAIDNQKDALEAFLESSNDFFQYIVTKCNKEIVKIKKYVFDDDQVTVTLTTETNIEVKYLENGKEKIKKDTYSTEDETVILQLVGEEWKIVYADLQYYNDVNVGAYTYSENVDEY